MNIIQDFIPVGRRNRPANRLIPKYITIHETGNRSRWADAKAHANYIKTDECANRPASWHFTVDERSIYQHLPVNENAWHAGDGGSGTGNRQSLSIEICVNDGANFQLAVRNASWLTSELMREHNIPLSNVVQHNRWSGKNCPETIRRTGQWQNFLNSLEPDWKRILRSKLDRPNDWIAFVERQSLDPLGKFLPDLIVKIAK